MPSVTARMAGSSCSGTCLPFRSDQRKDRLHLQFPGSGRLHRQRRQRHDPLCLRLQLEWLARAAVVHVCHSDLINEKIGYICNFLVLAACIVSAGNAMIRYAFGYSSNGWLELQWYMFAILVMFGASYTFKRNEHVRVEIFYLFLSERGQLWLDLIGTLFFLIPACLLLSYLSWPFFHQAYAVGEMSGNAGGLIRWPIKFVIPAGFVMRSEERRVGKECCSR